MSRTSIVAILAGFGILFTGEVTSEAVAFTRVVQTGDAALLMRYAKQNPDSPFVNEAIKIAVICKTNWVNGACDTTLNYFNTPPGGGAAAVSLPRASGRYGGN